MTNEAYAKSETRRRRTEDERLLSGPESGPERAAFTETDPWRVLRIMGEFVEGFEELADLGPSVTLFGSARIRPEDPMYEAAVEVGRLLGEAGFTVITGGGPGAMEAGNRAAREAGVASVGLNIELPFEQHVSPYVDVEVDFRYFLRPQGDAGQVPAGFRYLSRRLRHDRRALRSAHSGPNRQDPRLPHSPLRLLVLAGPP